MKDKASFEPSIRPDIKDVLFQDGWNHRSAGVYESHHRSKSYDRDFMLFVRETDIDGHLKKPSGANPAIRCRDQASAPDPNPTMGVPGKVLGPAATHAQLAGFERFPSLMSIRQDKPSLLIGFDTEYVGEPRRILSWQFAVVVGDHIREYVFLRKGSRLLCLEIALARILDDLGYVPVDSRKVEEEARDESPYYVTVVCHAGLADLTALDQAGVYKKNILRCCTSVHGGLVTLRPTMMRPRSVDPKYARNAKRYPIALSVADTMCHAPAKRKALRILGDVIGVPKVELPTEPISYIEHMDQLLWDDPRVYFEYAGQDCVVALMYLSSLYGFNKKASVTITGAGARVMKGMMMEYLNTDTTEDFNRRYRGVHTVKHGIVPREDGPGFVNNTSLEPISDKANTIQHYASRAYRGGCNSCSEVGYYPGETYDYDLKNAYPTAMCLVPDIDWNNPVKFEIRNEELTLQKWHVIDDVYDPLMPLLAYVRFEFPADVKYPCIPVNVDGIPVFPRTSKGLDGVYACGPELYLALKLGAKVWCETGYVLNNLILGDSASHSLRTAVYTLVKDRAIAKKLYGKGSLEELILKTIVNSGYGKTAQNVIEKHTWSAYRNEMESIGCSAITNPVSACMTTSIVRAELLAAQNQASELGYLTHSVTTDGFISDMPEQVLKSLDLYGIRTWVERARIFLTDGADPELWEMKHYQDDLVNFTTRGNVSLRAHGVCAHNSAKSGYEPDCYEDRLWLMTSVLMRNGPIMYTSKVWTSFKDAVASGEFSVKEKRTNVRMDFDMKRRPVKDSVVTRHPEVEGVLYEIANISTTPYESIDEFRQYRRIKENMTVLRTADDWERFFYKVELDAYGAKPRDLEWARLNSCLMGHRAGLWTIPALTAGTVEEKCEWLNRHNRSGHVVKPSDWKHAREPKRQANMLPREMIQDLLDELMSDED